MHKLARGRYLALVTRAIASQIQDLAADTSTSTTSLHAAEAADRLALHLSRVLQIGIGAIGAPDRVAQGVALVSALIDEIARRTDVPLHDEQPEADGMVLTGVSGTLPDGRAEHMTEPLVPLLDTALMTNAPGEPRIGQQIATEIPSADRIDLIMAFIRHSGIAPLLQALRRHCEAGRTLRVLTTSYTGSTEARALQTLQALGADVRVSYDETSTRLHAKAWLFQRDSGFSTAYVGSSNLTHSAQVSGLEWNVRFSAQRNPHVLDKMAALFESYWHSADFVPFDAAQFSAMAGRSRRPALDLQLSPLELRPEPFQERLLEQIALARRLGQHRNLLVAATGTGKTVMAAVDYARLRTQLPRARLLFVAHRKELLLQSLATFRHALRDAAFGELWVDGLRPEQFDHVFASVQSLRSAGTSHLPAAHFDVVVVDEFHHAEAPSYCRLLEHLQPLELLGLTATPERTDGLDLLHWFGGRIAAELRLWDAIDQQRLVPFVYYGIADTLDFTQVPWQRGRGYSIDALSNVITADDVWARGVIQALADKVSDVAHIRTLGFCVDIAHARFMARVFNQAGIRSVAVWADTPAADRQQALRDLANGAVQVLFSVDVFNEGIDIPAVDTLLLLRPTDSPTLFLQQLGRGLRRHHGKSVCTVIDFIGLHRREFRFDSRLRALIGGNRSGLATQLQAGFPYLPAGCHMAFDRVARDRVLASIRAAIPDRWDAKVAELRALAARGGVPTLQAYLDDTGLELDDIYRGGRCWTDLLEAAGLAAATAGPQEPALRRAVARLLHIDDLLRLDGYGRLLADTNGALTAATEPLAPESAANPSLSRLRRMLLASVCGPLCAADAKLADAAALLNAHPAVLAELTALLPLLRARLLDLGHLGHALPDHPALPLTVHARYSRSEIQAAFGDGDPDRAQVPAWREGVRWMRSAACDVLLVTLDKTGKQFSPTTRYRDYAISRELIHWESQSQTRADSPTGQRYQQHQPQGSSVMLFARLDAEERSFYFLGPVRYVRHQGEMPMQVTWLLRHPLPGDLFASFAAAVA